MKKIFKKAISYIIFLSMLGQFIILPEKEKEDKTKTTAQAEMPATESIELHGLDHLKDIIINCNYNATDLINTDTLSGSGTTEKPYIINNLNDLKYFTYLVNSGTDSFEGKYVKLNDDICLSSGEDSSGAVEIEKENNNYYNLNISGTVKDTWVPIGTRANPFKGHFLGNGYTIYNMAVIQDTKNLILEKIKNLLKDICADIHLEDFSEVPKKRAMTSFLVTEISEALKISNVYKKNFTNLIKGIDDNDSSISETNIDLIINNFESLKSDFNIQKLAQFLYDIWVYRTLTKAYDNLNDFSSLINESLFKEIKEKALDCINDINEALNAIGNSEYAIGIENIKETANLTALKNKIDTEKIKFKEGNSNWNEISSKLNNDFQYFDDKKDADYRSVLSYSGFFGFVKNGTIENLKISSDCSVIANTQEDYAPKKRDLLGELTNETASTAINFAQSGGIVGRLEGINSLVKNCTSDATVVSKSSKGKDCAFSGGIAGTWDVLGNEIRLENCVSAGNIYSSGYAGGIVGSFSDTATNIFISRCLYGYNADDYTIEQGDVLIEKERVEVTAEDKSVPVNTTTTEYVFNEYGEPERRMLLKSNVAAPADPINTIASSSGSAAGIVAGFLNAGYIAVFQCHVKGDIFGGDNSGGIIGCFGNDAQASSFKLNASNFGSYSGNLNKAWEDFFEAQEKYDNFSHNFNKKQLQMAEDLANYTGYSGYEETHCHHHCDLCKEHSRRKIVQEELIRSEGIEERGIHFNSEDSRRPLQCESRCCHHHNLKGSCEHTSEIQDDDFSFNMPDLNAEKYPGYLPEEMGTLEEKNEKLYNLIKEKMAANLAINIPERTAGIQIVYCSVIGCVSSNTTAGGIVACFGSSTNKDIIFSCCFIKADIYGEQGNCWSSAGICACFGASASNVNFENCNINCNHADIYRMSCGLCNAFGLLGNVNATDCVINNVANISGLFGGFGSGGNVNINNCPVITFAGYSGLVFVFGLQGYLNINMCPIRANYLNLDYSCGLMGYFGLGGDIVIKNCPVESSARAFGLIGNFGTGSSFTLENCPVIANYLNLDCSCGLMGYFGLGGDIVIKNCPVESSARVCGLMGNFGVKSNFTLENCSVKSCNLHAYNYSCGLFGISSASDITIKNCHARINSGASGLIWCLSAKKNLLLENCSVESEEITNNNFDFSCGLVGILSASTLARVMDEKGKVEIKSDGISSITVKNCHAKSNAQSSGLIGIICGDCNTVIDSCCAIDRCNTNNWSNGLINTCGQAGSLTVKNCKVKSNAKNSGMIGCIGVKENIILENNKVSNFNENAMNTGLIFAGGTGKKLIINNCTVDCDLINENGLFSLFGANEGLEITNCTVNSHINNTKYQSGGLFSNTGTGKDIILENNKVTGIVSGKHETGGMIGCAACEGKLFLNNCMFDGNVNNNSGKTLMSGGLIGASSAGSIEINGCRASGSIDANNSDTSQESIAGGLAGKIVASGGVILSDCHSHMNVSASALNNTFVGGLVGESSMINILKSCAKGKIDCAQSAKLLSLNSTHSVCGGLIGSCFQPYYTRKNLFDQCSTDCCITCCANKVSGTVAAGGLLGRYLHTTVSPGIINSSSIGNIFICNKTSAQHSGGLVGIINLNTGIQDQVIINSYAAKAQKYKCHKSSFTGGLIGFCKYYPVIKDSYFDNETMKVDNTIGNFSPKDQDPCPRTTLEMTGPGGELYFYYLKRVPEITVNWDMKDVWEYRRDEIFCSEAENSQHCCSNGRFEFCDVKLKYPTLRAINKKCTDNTLIKEKVYKKRLDLTQFLYENNGTFISVKADGLFSLESTGPFSSDGSGLYPACTVLNAKEITKLNEPNLSGFFACSASLEYGPGIDLQIVPPNKALVTVKTPPEFNLECPDFQSFWLNEKNRFIEDLNLTYKTHSYAVFETENLRNFAFINPDCSYIVNFPMSFSFKCCHSRPQLLGTITVKHLILPSYNKLAVFLSPPFYISCNNSAIPFQLSTDGGITWKNPVFGNEPVELTRFTPRYGQNEFTQRVWIRACCHKNPGAIAVKPNSQIHYFARILKNPHS